MEKYQKYLNRTAQISAIIITLLGALAILTQWTVHKDIMPRSAVPSQGIFILVGLYVY